MTNNGFEAWNLNVKIIKYYFKYRMNISITEDQEYKLLALTNLKHLEDYGIAIIQMTKFLKQVFTQKIQIQLKYEII